MSKLVRRRRINSKFCANEGKGKACFDYAECDVLSPVEMQPKLYKCKNSNFLNCLNIRYPSSLTLSRTSFCYLEITCQLAGWFVICDLTFVIFLIQ